DSTVFEVWAAFASAEETARMRQAFVDGIAWGEAKKQLFDLVDGELAEARDRYARLMDDPGHIESVLQQGAQRAREHSAALLARVREAVGISPLR
ncbi:MAG: tryptophan--tRNA ligase, partial [Halioglobus sp.]|nr:tryptophan--tRNA ligase [Halioglobus sp.]